MSKRALIACEESQEVTKALRRKGIEAFSCDIEPCSGGRPEWHIQDDVRKVLNRKWDFIGAHPPCTYLTNAQRWCYFHPQDKNLHVWLKRPHPKFPDRFERYREAVEFFNLFIDHPCKLKYIENPVPMRWLIEDIEREYDQTIQPYMFGEDAKKATCLWLFGLPKLVPTRMIIKQKYANQTPGGWNKLGPSKDRSKLRSKTYPGIAKAIADQWSKLIS